MSVIIFPHQLFKQHPSLQKGCKVYLVEEGLFFKQFCFHKQKLLLHRASMRYYADWLQQQEYEVEYIESYDKRADISELIRWLAGKGCTKVFYADVTDNWLHTRLHKACGQFNISLVEQPTPNFLNSLESVQTFFEKKKTYFQTAFYIEQRKQRKILTEGNGQPAGGQWSFDAENRSKYPAKQIPPIVLPAEENKYTREAKIYIEKYFSKNYGSIEQCIYPISHTDAEKWLDDFLEQRFYDFGKYEDALVAKEHFLHHSVLSPMLNMGLLAPQQIIEKVLAYALKHAVPMNSVEGFIRQIMGWREFIRIVYQREGSRQRSTNFWGFTRAIPASFWSGTTGIYPVDNVIQKTLQTGYSHHIERLMVMGNFMLLCEFDPNEVYKWFMEMYVDAYDWVMVPNVYGMTQFADGGLMTTKPYISGSNYLLKMSDYPKGDWTAIWDALFWRFMYVHRSFFEQNPRLNMLVKTFDKMPTEKKNKHLDMAEKYLSTL